MYFVHMLHRPGNGVPMNSKKYLLITLLALLAIGNQSKAATWEQTTWSGTIYYRTTFDAEIESDMEGTLHVAAVDAYEVYFNGTLMGEDAVWNQMKSYPVTIERGDNEIAVRVVNSGQGAGNGVLTSVVAGVEDSLNVVRDSTFAETTTDRSWLIWYWNDLPQEGTGWTTADPDPDEGWGFVQTGSVDKTQITDLVYPSLEIIAGFPGNADMGSVAGSLVLKDIQGQNLALNSVTNRINAVDGDLRTSWEPPTNALSNTASIDLQVRHNINFMRVITRAPDFADNSLKGYAVQISDDQIRWSEVGSLVDIVQFEKTEVAFRSSWTRFVRIIITQINGVTPPKVAEVEVFGEGFDTEAFFLSPPLDLDAPDVPKNFDRISWEGTAPSRTELTLQFRAGDTADNFDGWDEWSIPLTLGEHGKAAITFPSAEPRSFLQYRVNMESRDAEKTPEFHGIQFEFSTDDIPVSNARGRVAPNRVPMGVDTTFVYNLNLGFEDGDAGVEKIHIQVPSEAVLDVDGITGLDNVAVEEWRSTQNVLEIVFSEPVNSSHNISEVSVPFQAKSFANAHDFRAFLFGPGSANPLNAAENIEVDPLTDEPYSWAVIATTSRDKALADTGAKPPVFSPNGDGINDHTVIEFVLAKVDTPREVKIRIFDLSGRMVADLNEEGLAAGTYLYSGAASPGYWDGRDLSGNLVPPGLYLYEIEVNLDEDDEVENGVVGVAY